MHNIELNFIPTIILGATLLAFIYHAVLLIYSHDRFMKPYLVYLGCTSVFLFSKSRIYAELFGQMNYNLLLLYFKESIQIIYLTSYFQFIIEAIGLSREEKLFWFRYWPVARTLLLSYAVWSALSKVYFPLDDYTLAFISSRIFIFGVTGIMLYQSFKLRQNKFQRIILYGSCCYLIFGLVSFITNFFFSQYDAMVIDPIEWMMVGSFVDIVFFSFAIAYRNRREFENLNLSLLDEANKHIALQQVLIEKQAELENERRRIAADLHDDLGSGLTRISYLSQMALHGNVGQNLEKIKQTASDLVGNMGELIWVMKEENNTLEDLVTYIKSYAVDYFEPHHIGLTIDIPEEFENVTLDGQQRRHLFLSVKECLHNIVKHSKATAANISIVSDGALRIKVEDDGVGIETGKLQTLGGNGLKNMQSRIEGIHGEFEIRNGSGTQILFKIPLTKAV